MFIKKENYVYIFNHYELKINTRSNLYSDATGVIRNS